MTQTVRKELLGQLQHLRTEAKDISRVYLANLQRDIVQLIDFLNENPNHGGRAKNSRSTNSVLFRMKGTLDNITVKAGKGGRKDMPRIEKAGRAGRENALTD